MGSARFYIAIAEVIVYSLLLPLAIFVDYRHGILRSIGWFYLCVFCSLRIAGAALGIASENDRGNRNDLVWSEILGSVGLGPLLLVGFSLLSRVNSNCKPRSSFRVHAVHMLHFPNVLALALAIVGGVKLSSSTPSQQASGKQFAQAGISIFMAVFAIYLLICLLTWAAVRAVAEGEKWILYGVLLATPFIFLRILYAMLAVFRDNKTFAIVNGSATTQLGMGIIEEIIVVLVYVGVGILAPVEKRSEAQKSEHAMEQATT